MAWLCRLCRDQRREVAVVANMVYLVHDAPRPRGAVRVVTRVVLVLGVFGSVIGLMVQLVTLVRAIVADR